MSDEAASIPLTGADEAAVEYAISLLNRLLSHKSDSLFGYALEASPYVTQDDADLLKLLERIAKTHADQARIMARVIADLDAVPQPVGHDIGIADINYLSLRYLVRVLAEYQEHCIEEAQEALPYLAVCPAAAKAVEHVIETDRRDLGKLKTYLESKQ